MVCSPAPARLALALLLGMAGAASAARPAPSRPTDPSADAVAAVRGYYAALDRRAYTVAYRLWEDDGRASGQTLKAFRQGFARTAHTRVTAGPAGAPGGAAGSLYVTVPVTVDAVLKNGARQRFAGTYVLRRVNDVPGSTPDARRWHLHSAALKPA